MTLNWTACLVALAMSAGACNQRSGDVETEDAAAAPDAAVGTTGTTDGAQDGATRVADIVAAPDRYFGKTVTVIADVEEVLGPRSFALDEDAPLRGGIDRDLLVFSRNAADLTDIDDQWLNNKVRVSGTVGRYSVVEIERELGWDLDPQLEAELERSGAVLIASSVQRVSREAGARQDDPQRERKPTRTPSTPRDTLPDGASPLPSVGVGGLFALGTAIAIRYLRR